MKEVISLPAGQTTDIIKKYLIHAHPHPRNYKDSQYMTFRKIGGVMDTLYSVQCEFVLNPKDPDLKKKAHHLSSDIIQRLIGYVNERKRTFGFEEKEEYKFYILEVFYELSHLPKPKERKLQSHTYYTFNEITCGKREISRDS